MQLQWTCMELLHENEPPDLLYDAQAEGGYYLSCASDFCRSARNALRGPAHRLLRAAPLTCLLHVDG
jgi:hypothetical protein